MVAFSKYFYQAVNFKDCNEIIHDGSCLQSTIWNFTQTVGGCTKFVLPLALLPIIMKFKKLDKHVLKQSMQIFVDYFLGSWLISGFGLSFICLFRKMFGYFSYFSVLAYPGGVGAAICASVLAERVIYTYAHGLSTIAFEISINRGDFYIFKKLRNYRVAITLAFMLLNMVLLHGLRENKSGGFYWLIQPLKRKNEYHDIYEVSPIMDRLTPAVRSQLKLCEHNKSCDSYILEGITNYLKFGLGLEMGRNIIYNYNLLLKHPTNIIQIIFKQLNWNLITFLVGYAGTYRFCNCLANRHNINQNDVESTKGHSLSAFLGGLAFYLYPNFAIFSHTAITTIELYWKLYFNRIKTALKWIPLENIAMARIVYPLVFGYLLHIRAFTPWLAPSMLKKLMHLTTNFKDASVYTKYHDALFGLHPQFSL